MQVVFMIILTYGLYRLAKWLAKRIPILLFHPLLFTPALIIIVIHLLDIEPTHYSDGTALLTHMLGPATIAFAIPIYKHIHFFRKNFAMIMIAVIIGSFVAIFSTLALALLVKLEQHLLISLLPRSITTPLAMEVSASIDGVPALTIVFVILTGIMGSLMAPFIFKIFRIKTPMAKGLALGMSAHAVGTNRAIEYGDEATTFSTLAMIFAGIVTVILGLTLLPQLVALL
ncbi:LrgB family protein [Amphibacillus sediminis]|uniref:LrgB family protein n=1 Tax=Amphibacillus sediminis TaxID=360185 RepID=UPI00082F9996|nr:LrgB family protein [Amphibacillus sediminis]